MAKLNFKAGGTSRKLKRTPSKYRESLGRPNISQSAGVRPAFPLMPYEHLELKHKDVSTEDYIVIPKGRIVSAITSNTNYDKNAYPEGDYYGVAKGIMGLMVPCNGSVSAINIDSPVASGQTLAASLPIGIAEHDVYQDIGGTNLNYDMRNKNWGVLCHQLIKVPSINLTAFDAFFVTANQFGTTSAVGQADFSVADGGYKECEKLYSWLSYTTTLGADAGDMVAADAYGNYVVTATADAKVVGKIMGVDYRFNKDLLDTVQSKYDDGAAYRLSGTGTFGIPQHLYDFAYKAIDAALSLNSQTWAAKADFTVDGTALAAGIDPAKLILHAVEEGVFGEAWILINI